MPYGSQAGVPPSVVPVGPTQAAPGTPEKIAVMEARAQLGLDLFHPSDARGPALDADGNEAKVSTPAPQTGGRRERTGVSRHKGKWRARGWDQERKRSVSLGLFETEEEAKRAVAEHRKRHGQR